MQIDMANLFMISSDYLKSSSMVSDREYYTILARNGLRKSGPIQPKATQQFFKPTRFGSEGYFSYKIFYSMENEDHFGI
jgi:hypothetical protein